MLEAKKVPGRAASATLPQRTIGGGSERAAPPAGGLDHAQHHLVGGGGGGESKLPERPTGDAKNVTSLGAGGGGAGASGC